MLRLSPPSFALRAFFFSCWNISNLCSNKCENPWDLSLDCCWFYNRSIKISLKGNFLTYLILCSVTPLQGWLFTGSYIHCQFHPHIHWKNFSSVLFLLVIVFTLLILLLLYITYNSKVCPLQNYMDDCNVSCANASMSFSTSWMGCHSFIVSCPNNSF